MYAIDFNYKTNHLSFYQKNIAETNHANRRVTSVEYTLI